MTAPFNFIVTWTWPILGLAAIIFSLGWSAQSRPAQNVILPTSYALGFGTLASNLCAGVRYARGESELFAVCDVVGIAAGAAVEGTMIHYTCTNEEWDVLAKVPEMARNGVTRYLSEAQAVLEEMGASALEVMSFTAGGEKSATA